ncbi:uncharacterized protein METZ01_LOCUS347981, partial [marine metagenome]
LLKVPGLFMHAVKQSNASAYPLDSAQCTIHSPYDPAMRATGSTLQETFRSLSGNNYFT